MSTRYVWGQYTKQTQTDYVTRYRAASSSTDDEGHSNSSYLNFSGLDVLVKVTLYRPILGRFH